MPISKFTHTPALFLLCLSLGSCNLAPTYFSPKPSLPSEFKSSGPWRTAKPQDHLTRGPWWHLLNDARLTDLQRQAQAANPTLEVAQHRVEEAKARARADSATLLPFLTANTSAKRARNSAAIDGTFAGGQTITKLRGTLDFSYELDLWGRLRNTSHAAQANAEAAQADYQTALLSLQGEVALNYYALQAQDETIALLKRTTAVRRRAVELAKARFRQGDTAQLDVAQAETELAATESQAIGLEKKRHELEHAIALLTGQTPSTFSLPAMALASSPPSLPTSLPSDLLERRPDIAAAERAMAALNAEIGIATAALFPSFKLGLSSGTESSFLRQLATSASHVWGIGPDLQWSVLELGKNRAKITAAKARYQAAAATYRATVLQAVREVEDALSGIAVLQRQSAMQRQTVAAAQRTVDLAQKRYDAGLVAFFEVLDAQRTLLHAEEEATAISGEHFTSTVLLIKALGGGW
jgi:multidrug efflux system outer membrane protein